MDTLAALLLFLKNHKRISAGSSFVIILCLAIIYVPPIFYNQNSEKSKQPSLTNINQNNFNSDGFVKNDPNMKNIAGINSVNESFNPEEWIIAHYDKISDDNFLCPSSWSSFSSPEIWNNELVLANFKRITISFEVKNKKQDDQGIPTFIFSLGNKDRILRFYTPQKTKEGSAQYVGFQKIKPPIECKELWGECNWEPSQSLDEPIATGPGRLILLQVDTQYKGDNIVGYVFTLNYPSALTFKKINKVFPYDIVIPAPDPSLYKVKWGVGTFKDSCFRINSVRLE